MEAILASGPGHKSDRARTAAAVWKSYTHSTRARLMKERYYSRTWKPAIFVEAGERPDFPEGMHRIARQRPKLRCMACDGTPDRKRVVSSPDGSTQLAQKGALQRSGYSAQIAGFRQLLLLHLRYTYTELVKSRSPEKSQKVSLVESRSDAAAAKPLAKVGLVQSRSR